MIAPGTRFEGPRRVPLALIVDPSTRRISPRWLMQYWRELTAPGHEQHDADPLMLSPRGDGRYTIEDGRHRFYASLMAGRREVLALVITEPPADRSADDPASRARNPAAAVPVAPDWPRRTARRRWQAVETAAPAAQQLGVRA